MTRALLLADGPSDEPLGRHVELIARRHGFDLDVVTPDLRRLDPSPGLHVADRLSSVLQFDDRFDLVIVHRDAEGQDPRMRHEEVRAGVAAARADLPHLPVVPIRMTEAWLLVDEVAIRRVAGRPSGTVSLDLPAPGTVEQVPNPKEILREVLERASQMRGRRLHRFRRDFGGQRRRLLEALDHAGPVSQLSAWQELATSVPTVLGSL